MTNEELLNVFKRDLELSKKDRTKNTIKTYLQNIRYFINFIGDKSILDATEDDVLKYMDTIQNLSTSTYNTRLASISSFYNTLQMDRNISRKFEIKNIANNVERYKVKNKIKTALSIEEQNVLINNANNSRTKAIFTVMFECGLRVHELSALTLSQYKSMDENVIILTETKGSKERYLVLNQKCIDAIEEYLPERNNNGCDKLFVSNQGTAMNRQAMSRTIKNIAKKSGFFTDDKIDKMCNHLLRSSMATTALNEKGLPIDIVQIMLGHQSLNTTRIYAKTDLNRVRQAMCG